MTTLATDNFNRANAGNLGANWTDIDAGLEIISNEAQKSSGTEGSSRYTAVSFPDDQWAQVTVGSAVDSESDEGVGPVVRGQAGGDWITLQSNAVESRVYKRIGGGYTQLGSDGPSVASGDVLYLEIQGTTIIAKKNGSSICGSPIALGGASPASGNAGVRAYSLSGSMDDFSAGDFAAAGGLVQEGFRFRNDDGSESGATWKASQDLNILLALDQPFRLRALIDTTGDQGSKRYRLEYKKPADSTWLVVKSGEGAVRLNASANIAAGGEVTTPQLTAPAGKTTADFSDGRAWDDENGADYITIVADEYTELEWSIILTSPAVQNERYQFRVTQSV
jgi:hypothetical protein